MKVKSLLVFAFALTISLANAQTSIAQHSHDKFDEGKAILEARKKGIPDGDVIGYVNAERAKFMAKHNLYHTEEVATYKKVTVVNMNTRQIAQGVQSSLCGNSDLSLGTYANWTGDISNSNSTGVQYPVNNYSGTGINGNNGSAVLLNTDPCNGSVSTDRQVIMSTPILALTTNPAAAFSNGYDPTCQNPGNSFFDLSMIPVNGVNSIRMGSAYPQYTGEKLRYAINVTSTNALFTYRYAVVIADGGHGVGEQPAFTFQLKDQNGTPIGGICGKYDTDATAASTDTSFTKSISNCINIVSPSYYRKWHTVTLDLSAQIGNLVYADFETMDCIYSGHYCYAYISATCGNLNATVTGFCGTSGSAVCTAPGGFASYQWYGPNNTVPIVGATNQIYTASGAVLGDVFSVDCVTPQGCTTKLNVTVIASNIAASPSALPSCRGGSNGSAAVLINGGTSGFSYTWTPTNANTPGITGLPTGDYSVHITDNSGNCPPKDTVVHVGVLPPPLTFTTSQLCGNVLAPSLQVPAGAIAPYSWTMNGSTAVIGTASTLAFSNTVAPTDYFVVTYKDPTTGCLDSLKTTLNQVTIDFNPFPQPACNGGTNGNITFSPQNGTSFPQYNWTVNGNNPNTFYGHLSDSMSTHMPNGSLFVDSLAGGVYTVVVFPAGNPTCSWSGTVTITQGTLGAPTLATLKGCPLDVINAAPPGTGGPGYTHAWYTVPAAQHFSYPLVISGALLFANASYTDTIKNPYGCKSVYKVTIKVESFNGSITSSEGIHCHGDSTGKIKVSVSSETNGPIGNPYTFNWNYPAPYQSSSPGTLIMGATPPQSTQEQGLHPGTYTVLVTSGNCAKTFTYTLVDPAPLNDDTLNAFYCPKDDSALLVVTELGHPKYTWLLNHVTPVPNYINDSIWVKTGDVNNYWVAYLDKNCKDTAKILITFPSYHALRPDTTVNIFTPNGDDRNDDFYPFYSKGFSQIEIDKQMESFEMYIYNRWGKLVFSTNEYAKPWNGNDQSGKPQDDGTYYYIFKYKSNCGTKADLVEKKGFVQLLR